MLSCAYTCSPSLCPKQLVVVSSDHARTYTGAEDQGCQWKFSGKPFVSMVIFIGQSHAKTSTECCGSNSHRALHIFKGELIPLIVFYELAYFK